MKNETLKIETVSADMLNKNPWNTNIVDPENQDKLDASIERLDVFKPVIIRTLDDGSFAILGGEHRVDYAQRNGTDVDVVNLGSISDQQAKEISLTDTGRDGSDSALGLSELLTSPGAQDALTSFSKNQPFIYL